MNKKVLATVFLAALLTVSQIVLIMQVQSLKKLINDLEDKTEEYEESVCDFQKKQDLQISKINEEIKIVLEKQEENTSLIKNELNLVKQKSEAQFSKTVVMSKTYDAILEEQKKRTIDTAEKDTDFIESKKNAIALYEKENYQAAFDEFEKLTKSNTEDMKCRLYKAKALFYKNPADSSSYESILEDIRILKMNAAADDEVIGIESSILLEKEGLDE